MSESGTQDGSQQDDSAVLATARIETNDCPSTRVVAALDEATDADWQSGTRTLYDVVDPDALDALFDSTPRSDRASGSVSFVVAGVRVFVTADGVVTVTDENPL